jgi:hypothetical protein
MTADPKRNEAVEANKAMNREFNDDPRKRRTIPEDKDTHRDADDIREEGVEQANDAARVRKPFP